MSAEDPTIPPTLIPRSPLTPLGALPSLPSADVPTGVVSVAPVITIPVANWPADLTRYAPIRLLGNGGMGEVYLAHDSQLERQVAIKFARHTTADTADQILTEARTAARLHHPGICPVFDADKCGGVPYLTMAFVPGPSLAAELKRLGRCTPGYAAAIVRSVAEAMQYAHQNGVIHRDLKPGNILLTAERQPVVTDFGLAVRTDGQGPEDGVVSGTPHYMAPEQAAGDAARIGPRTDVYALGIILFEMLTARRPFEGTGQQVYETVKVTPVPPVESVRANVPPELARIVARATAFDLDDRYPDMTAFADALGQFLPHEQAPVKKSRGWVFWLTVAGVLVAAVAASVGLVLALQRPQQAAPATGTTEPPESPVAVGDRFAAAGQWEKAWACYSQAVEADPDDLVGRERRGELALKLEKLPEAESDFTVLLRENPNRADYHSGRGMAIFWRAWAEDAITPKKLELALDAANVAVTLDPNHARGFQLRADVAVEQKDYRQAEADATRAIELEPDDPVHWRSRGLARSLAGKEAEALADADHAAELERRLPPAPPAQGK